MDAVTQYISIKLPGNSYVTGSDLQLCLADTRNLRCFVDWFYSPAIDPCTLFCCQPEVYQSVAVLPYKRKARNAQI